MSRVPGTVSKGPGSGVRHADVDSFLCGSAGSPEHSRFSVFPSVGEVIISNLLGPGKCVRRQRDILGPSSPGGARQRPHPRSPTGPWGRARGGRLEAKARLLSDPASKPHGGTSEQGKRATGGLGESWVREHRGDGAGAGERPPPCSLQPRGRAVTSPDLELAG